MSILKLTVLLYLIKRNLITSIGFFGRPLKHVLHPLLLLKPVKDVVNFVVFTLLLLNSDDSAKVEGVEEDHVNEGWVVP